jgi:cytoskeletal protein RodZ
MALPIGQKLRELRLARGLSLEDVRHQTHISRAMLIAMENDDIAAFGSLTYARKFFASYAGHLGVDAADFLRHFHPHGLRGVIDFHSYLQPPTDRVINGRANDRNRATVPALIALIALILTAAAGYWAGRQTTAAPQEAVAPPSGPSVGGRQ